MPEFLQKNWKVVLGIFILIAFVIAGIGVFMSRNGTVEIDDTDSGVEVAEATNLIPYDMPVDASPITGESCANYDKRVYGIMLNGDRSARQYFSNITQADFVAEIPHRAEHGQPRVIAFFGCNTPEVVGPMRSGRVDHINVADSLDAIYVPWGGSSIAKALQKKGVVDQIDCNGEVAPVGGDACFRRSGPMSVLEKASSSMPKLIEVANQNGFRGSTNFEGFDHQGELSLADRPTYSKVSVKYEDPYRVEYLYDRESNSYKRFFEDAPDIDYETKQQFAPKNLITIITKKDSWRKEIDYVAQGLNDPWDGVDTESKNRDSGQYPNMQLGDPWYDTKFEGEARFFFNGKEIEGTWKKEDVEGSSFEFYDEKGAPVHFVPGQIWMHVLGHSRKVSHTDEDEYIEEKNEALELQETGGAQ